MRRKPIARGIRHVDLAHAQLASSETARDINRDIILELIRTRQPISRAELSRISGLQRSTVSCITEQLMAEKWIMEGAVARLPRGRRPTLLELNNDIAVIAVDIHPKQSAAAVIDLKGHILSRIVLPVLSDPVRTVARLIEQIKAMIEKFPQKSFEGIGVSLPGRIDPRTQRLIFAPNLKWPEKWPDFDIKNEIEKGTGLQVQLDNGANACLRSEMWFGHMEGTRNAVLVTVAEGVGTGVLANGQLVLGENGMAGEFGHIPLDPSGPRCGCGYNGCWEIFCSCRAALRYYAEFAPRAKRVNFTELLSLAEEGEPSAIKAIKKQAYYLGRGLRIIVAALSPEIILIAGDITSAWHIFAKDIEDEIAGETLAGLPPKLVPTHEGDIAFLRGAGALVLQRQASEGRIGGLVKQAHASA